MTTSRAFLTAEWRYLLMLNYEIDPQVLAPLVPAGVELDTWQDKTLVSVVGFLFLKTRVLGIPVPGHRNFEEVNLRFYVRRKVGSERRRGVVFVKEIVPRPWIARVANGFYGEHYAALPMGHTIEPGSDARLPRLVEYTWRLRRGWARRSRLHRLGGLAVGGLREIAPGSEEEFITEHYWGYTRLGARRTGEYRVEHPRWRVWAVEQPYLLCDVRALYGPQFEAALCGRPRSALLAEGSPVTVYMGGSWHVE